MQRNSSEQITACRSCGSNDIPVFLDLGTTPLANALVRPEALDVPESRFPLKVCFCQRCSLVQLTETVAPEILFSEYLYLSSFSETMVEHARQLVERVIKERSLDSRSFVGEVASNDGYLLQWYARAGISVLGIEPARNIARVAIEKGVPTDASFFGLETAQRIARENGRFDVLHANNVLAHVAGLNDVVAGIATVLKPTGVASIECPYVADLVENLEFDTIYHEHLCYFSLTALVGLFARHGLVIADAERLAIHGGSLRLWARHAPATQSGAVSKILDDEKRQGLTSLPYYADFSVRVSQLKTELLGLLSDLRRQGKRVAAYGASAKGSTLLNAFDVPKDALDFVADRSTYKQGLHTPGLHLPIVPPTALLKEMPDYVLLLTWNFAEEILKQQSAYRERGGRFVVPLPHPHVV